MTLVKTDEITNLVSRPREVMSLAQDCAEILMEVVDQKRWYTEIEGKRYLQVEAWQTIGLFYKVRAMPVYVKPIEVNGEAVAYEARVDLVDANGIICGSGIMSCGLDEFVARGKQGWGKQVAAQSMAQTRATSKAYRLNYGFVAVLAGYDPSTAEEMQVHQESQKPLASEYFCNEHKTDWFKTSKMPRFAHPIADTQPTKWCDMRQTPPAPPLAVQAPQRPAQASNAGRHSDIPDPLTDEGFVRLAGERGWGRDETTRLLGGVDVYAWLKLDKKRTLYDAFVACAQQAEYDAKELL